MEVEEKQPETGQNVRLTLRWFVGVFALLGFATGYFSGASQSPVVNTLLPLLFGLMGGASGFHLLRMDISSQESIRLNTFLAKGLVLFTAFCLVGTIYGTLLRTGRSLFSIMPISMFRSEKMVDIPHLDEHDANRLVQLALLRSRLQAIGVPAHEQRVILLRASESVGSVNDNPVLLKVLKSSSVELDRTKSAFKTTLDEITGTKDSKVPESITNLFQDMRLMDALIKYWIKRLEAHGVVPVADVKRDLLLYSLRFFPDLFLRYERTKDAQWWHDHPKLQMIMVDFSFVLEDALRRVEPFQFDQKNIDQFLGVVYSRREDKPVPWEKEKVAVKATEERHSTSPPRDSWLEESSRP